MYESFTPTRCGLPGQVAGQEEEGGQIWARQIFDHVKVDYLDVEKTQLHVSTRF